MNHAYLNIWVHTVADIDGDEDKAGALGPLYAGGQGHIYL